MDYTDLHQIWQAFSAPLVLSDVFFNIVFACSGLPLVTNGVLHTHGTLCVFTRDHLFTSPSMAAGAVLGRSANGWVEWKTAQGQTLDGAKRQNVVLVS